MEKGQKQPIRIAFLKVVNQNEKNEKNDFYQKLPDTICMRKGEEKRAFSCTLSVLAKHFWAQNSESQENYKNSGFSGNCPKPKVTPFFGKKCLLARAKKWFLLTVFLKSCASRKHYFYSVFNKTQQML